jgi:hypothetical protein
VNGSEWQDVEDSGEDVEEEAFEEDAEAAVGVVAGLGMTRGRRTKLWVSFRRLRALPWLLVLGAASQFWKTWAKMHW